MKLKQKLQYLSAKINGLFSFRTILLGGILAFFVPVLLGLPDSAAASCSGVVSPFSCDQSTIALTFPSGSYKIGDKVTFTVTINNNTGLNNILGDISKTQKTVEILTGSKIISTKSLPANSSNTVTFDPVTIGGQWFTEAQTYKIYAAVDLGGAQSSPDTQTVNYSLNGPEISFLVAAADANQPPSLAVDQTQKAIIQNSSSVSVSYSITYLKGNSTARLSQFLYYCDFTGDESTGYKPLSSSSLTFACIYSQNAGSHRVFVKALDTNNKTIVSKEVAATITGNEKNEGAQTITSSIADSLDIFKDAVAGVVNSIVKILAGIVNELVFFLFYYVVAPLVQAMLSIHTYSDTFVNVIYPGWEIIRNICNILFIIALIAMGLGTLFRLENYHYRHLLVQIIIAAVLVNFSLIIGQAVLGFSETFQAQFLPDNVSVVRSLGRDLMVANTRNAFTNWNIAELGSFSYTITLLFYVAMSIGALGVFSAIAVYLVIRIVMLWILLMVSPIAYVAGILPGTANYRQQWWSTFIKYAFFAPIMAFMLNLAAVMSNASREQNLLQSITTQTFANSNAQGVSQFIFLILSNFVLLIFLLAALKVAESFSIMGASTITKFAERGMWAPFNVAGKVASAPFRKGYESAKFAANRTRLQNAINLQNSKNPFAKTVGKMLSYPERQKAKEHDREQQIKNLTKQLGAYRGDELRNKRGLKGREETMEAMNEQMQRLVKTMENLIVSSEDAAHEFHEFNEAKDPIERQAGMEASMMSALKMEDMKGFLKNMGYTGDRQGYLQLMLDLQQKYGFSKDRAEYLDKMFTIQGRNNNQPWVGKAFDEHHNQKGTFSSPAELAQARVLFNGFNPAQTTEAEYLQTLDAAQQALYKKYLSYLKDLDDLDKRRKNKSRGDQLKFDSAMYVYQDPAGNRHATDEFTRLIIGSDKEIYSAGNQISEKNRDEQIQLYANPDSRRDLYNNAAQALVEDYRNNKKQVISHEQALNLLNQMDINLNDGSVRKYYSKVVGFDTVSMTKIPRTTETAYTQLENDPAMWNHLAGIEGKFHKAIETQINNGFADLKNFVPRIADSLKERIPNEQHNKVHQVNDDIQQIVAKQLSGRIDAILQQKNITKDYQTVQNLKTQLTEHIGEEIRNAVGNEGTQTIGQLQPDLSVSVHQVLVSSGQFNDGEATDIADRLTKV